MIRGLIEFVNGLSSRERILFYGAAVAVFLVGLDQVMVRPILSEIDLLDRKIRAKETSIGHALAVLKHKERIGEELRKYAKYLEPPGDYEEEMLSVLEQVQRLADRCSVVPKDIKPVGKEDASLSRRYRVRLTCEAEMKSLLDFMYALEGSEKLLEIEKWTIIPKQEGSSVVTCTMEISRTVIL